MKEYSLIFLITIFLSSCCGNTNEDLCPGSNFGDWIPENENFIRFISNEGIEATIYLTSDITEQTYGCECRGIAKITGDFYFNTDIFQLEINIQTEENNETINFLEVDEVDFTFDQLNFNYRTNNQQFSDDDVINLGSYALYPTQIIDETYQIISEDGGITEVLYSIEDGLIQFTTLDNTIWKRQF